MLQGLALGGEYGGAATYVAEHAPEGSPRLLHLVDPDDRNARPVPVADRHRRVQGMMGKEAFAAWGWRIPFLLSAVLLGVSVWIRLKMNESPAFQKMKEEGKGSKAPLTEAFGQWKNAKIALWRCSALTAGQAVVWYRVSSTRCSSCRTC
jgi:hypothetical protein